ncbi:Cof-type HAD-IIB family hydrolase [Clostridium saudiense]|nr:Cof-type HAD-IIB family hydrolase [Clostridium saudiense]
MSKKVIFLDVDGTLVNDNGVVPESAKIAVRKAKENGHYVFLCTGRSKAELYDDIMEIGFDGVIGAAGGYIEVNNEMILHKKVSREDVEHLVRYFDENNIDFYLESNGGLFASKNCKKTLNRLVFEGVDKESEQYKELEKGIGQFIEALIEGENLIRDDINKVSFLDSETSIEVIKEEFKDKFNVIHCTVPMFGENSGELSVPGVHKALAIEYLLNYLGLSKDVTFAYGDGINDMEMLQYVNCGIAMGNAKEALKEIACDITGTHDEDGIYNSFKKYRLI